MPTYSTTVRSSSDDIVLDLQVRVEDRCVELGLAVEAVADTLPIGGRLGHCRDSSVHAHVTSVVLLCRKELCCGEAQVGNMEMQSASQSGRLRPRPGLCRLSWFSITLHTYHIPAVVLGPISEAHSTV